MTGPKLRTATEFVNERLSQHQKANDGNLPKTLILPPWVAANLILEHEEHFPYYRGEAEVKRLVYWGVTIKPTGTPGDLEDCIALARMFQRVRHLVEGDQTVSTE